jgi:hypothetical protein
VRPVEDRLVASNVREGLDGLQKHALLEVRETGALGKDQVLRPGGGCPRLAAAVDPLGKLQRLPHLRHHAAAPVGVLHPQLGGRAQRHVGTAAGKRQRHRLVRRPQGCPAGDQPGIVEIDKGQCLLERTRKSRPGGEGNGEGSERGARHGPPIARPLAL